MFDNELRQHAGKRVQLVTSSDVVSGVLISANNLSAIVRTAQYPGYGGSEDVVTRLDVIAYVRIFV
jgi:hypothetical protein